MRLARAFPDSLRCIDTYQRRKLKMKLVIAKWGNSLAVRLPVECTRAAGLKEGDRVEASVTPEGDIALVPEKAFDKGAFLVRLAKLQKTMPMTEPVVERMRRETRY